MDMLYYIQYWYVVSNENSIINNSNMLKLILTRSLSLGAGFKIQKFDTKDYKTMCSLIKQKYPVINEAVQINKDIRLLDERGKLIGQYSASEARKKAANMKKDIILVNPNANPAICKIDSFRESVLKKFYAEVVEKRNESLMKKASSSKQLKIATNLGENDIQIKAKQAIELAKKNFNVRIFSICKPDHREEGLSKFDHLKSLVQNKCTIEKDIEVNEFEEKDQFDFSSKKKAEEKQIRFCISMTIKSKENQFSDLIQESSQKDPETALEIFLKRYYKQEDVEMRDLQATSNLIEDSSQMSLAMKSEPLQSNIATIKRELSQQKKREIQMLENSYEQKQAKARILNHRLKRILDII